MKAHDKHDAESKSDTLGIFWHGARVSLRRGNGNDLADRLVWWI